MSSNPVAWFEIYVQDMPRATAFYEAVLGHKLEPLSDPSDTEVTMMAFPMEMDRVGAGGALVKMQDGPSGPGGTLIYFACEDVAVEASRIVDAGGKVFKEKFSIGPYGDIALGFDTEGNMFGLHNPPAGENC